MRKEFIRSPNGARCNLREEGREKGETRQVVFLLDFAARNVNDVAKRLEGEEGDADGQEDVQMRDEIGEPQAFEQLPE